MKISKGKTERGFRLRKFEDIYGHGCSIQKSSLATDHAIWFGIDDAKPELLATAAMRLGLPTGGKTTGWVPFAVPSDVSFHTRMHLTRRQVAKLLPILQHFAETGELP